MNALYTKFAAVAIACAFIVQPLQAVEFEWLPFDSGVVLAGDGNTAFGRVAGGSAAWSKAGGLRPLPQSKFVADVSVDGRTAVGNTTGAPALWRLQDDGTFNVTELEAPPNSTSNTAAYSVSDDGASMLIGWNVGSIGPPGSQGLILWSDRGGYVDLAPPEGTDSLLYYRGQLSGDGETIVSPAMSGVGPVNGKRVDTWRMVSGDWEPLGSVAGGGGDIEGKWTSHSGSIVVGRYGATAWHGFRWTQETGYVDLGMPPLAADVSPTEAVADGSLVVGGASFDGSQLDLRAFVWDSLRGMQFLDDVLANDYGLEGTVAGWRLEAAQISDDGLTIAGQATSIEDPSVTKTWLVRLDHPILAPGDTNGDGTIDLGDFGTLKANFGTGTSRAKGDLNFDFRIDLSDFGVLKANFGQGAANATVPEPAALSLALVAMGVLTAAVTRRSRTRDSARGLCDAP